MTKIDKRLAKLEALTPDPWNTTGITFNMRNCRKDGKQPEKTAYQLSMAGEQLTIQRQPNESESDFIERATAIRDSYCRKPKGNEVPPTPIMYQVVEDTYYNNSERIRETADRLNRIKRGSKR